MLIGITEAGDASLDYAWVNKMPMIDGAILITKNITPKFIDEILKVKDKVILHASCTGYGGTVVEPNLPEYTKQLDNVKKLIELGFPKNQIIVRIDPIIPTEEGIKKVERIVEYIKEDIQRFRVSVIDMYPHVQTRFKEVGLPVPFNGQFQASEEEFKLLDDTLRKLSKDYGVTFESCAEKYLYSVKKTGCVSEQDINLLGLELDDDSLKHQRPNCMCCSAKTELLEHKTKNYGCEYKCLYCYWK